MQIGAYDVPYEMLRYAALNAYDDHIAAGGKEITAESLESDEGDAIHSLVMTNAHDSLKSIYAVFALGEKYGIKRDNEAIVALVDSKLEEQRAGYGSDKEYKSALEEMHMTMGVSRVTLEFEVIYEEIYNAMLDNGDIETDENKLREIFDSDDFIRVKELLFATERHSAEECRTLAESALSEIEGGADFDEYIQENGESLFMFNNDDGYYLCRGIWEEKLEDAAFGLEIGEMSDIISTEDGARILKRVEKSSDYIDENMESLTKSYTEGVFRRTIEDQISEMTVKTLSSASNITILTLSEEAK